jgi:hypothetical protein
MKKKKPILFYVSLQYLSQTKHASRLLAPFAFAALPPLVRGGVSHVAAGRAVETGEAPRTHMAWRRV